MKTNNYIEQTAACMDLLDNIGKIRTDAYFETHQMAYMERKLNTEKQLYDWKKILKPALIVMLLAINVSIVYSYISRTENYTNQRNKAVVQLSVNLLGNNDYYSSN